MKSLLIILFTSILFAPNAILSERWVIERNSSLSIEGRSNVSSFRCDVTEYLQQDTILFVRTDLQQPVLTAHGGLTINVNRFDCHQKYINSDLRKTLKANECPWLKIDLLSIGNFSTGSKNVRGAVAITLAGVTKKLDVAYVVQNANDGTVQLYGMRQVLFSDFGLVPPRKLAGLIKVEEEINVRFVLVLRPLQTNPAARLN